MTFLSEIIGKPVADTSGEAVGILKDLIAASQLGIPHPAIVALLVKRKKGTILVPFSDVVVLVAPAIPLNKKINDVIPYELSDNDLCLVQDVWDKQIIDTNGVRVVRVNDVELTRVNEIFYVANVDIGSLGLLRRLGLAKVIQKMAGRLKKDLRDTMISWDNVELLRPEEPMRLKVPEERISELHPADLAEIISDLNHIQSGRLLNSLDVETLADTLEEVETDFQASLVENMSDEKVADILEEMSPDEAADLLAELPKERSEDLLNLMEAEDAEDVRKLLAYDEDTAGGIMTTEFIALPPNLTAEQAIATLREEASEAETIFYVYVVDSEEHLLGVFSLKDLILAKPETPVEQFMHKRVVAVQLDDSQDDVAQLISKYNLLAVPVVDGENCLHGIVTSDDALDKIIPTAWKKRLPKLYH